MRKILPAAIFLSLLLILAVKRPVLATDPHLFLLPTSGSYSSGFTIDVKVDTGGQAAGGVDVYLEFPKDLLRIENVTKGTAFPEVYSLIKNDEGKLRINAYFSIGAAGESLNTSDGLIGKINFSPKGSGTAPVKFICSSGSTTESNIVEKIAVRDIIVCSANVNGSYSVSAVGVTPTPTPIPTTSPGAVATPTPQVPVTGVWENTIALVAGGLLFLLVGLKLF